MKAVTLSDIAQKAGVSVMTASAALRGKGRLSDETRKRVKEIAARLGYRANSVARATRTGRFDNITLLMSTEEHRSYLPPTLLDAIHDTLAGHELRLTLAKLPDQKLVDSGALPRILREYSSDGLLIDYTFEIPDALIRMIERQRTPAIFLNVMRPNNCVHVDEVYGGRALTEHLLELGHRRIVYVDTWWGERTEVSHHSVRDRRAGYEQAMTAARLRPRYLLAEQAHPPQLVEQFRSLLTGKDRPTAAVTYWTSDAWPLLRATRAVELLPGRDISIASFARPDDHAVQGLGLTAFIQPEREMGSEGVNRLIGLMKPRAEPAPPAVLRGGLQPGVTTGPLKGGK
ncbi:MAG: LacI family DNA-binding transcriptional regulator [Phycisphaeraceae bacterium]|nr:LacI family DNA-binding transcriptional regulator [Phycisphaeraceae bacterium]